MYIEILRYHKTKLIILTKNFRKIKTKLFSILSFMQPQPSGGDQGQTAKALYDYQAGKYGDKLENTTPSALEVLENRKIRKC